MFRSAVDATRFTATSPHAYSKPRAPSFAASNTPPPSSAPRNQPSRSHPAPGSSGAPRPGVTAPNGGETPKEKVTRLRAAHEAAKQAQVTRWDRIVVRGRVWADVAHRVTVLGLIGVTVVTGVVMVYALVDLSWYNRRKKKVFYAEQYALLHERLAAAREAAARGEADEDQMLLLNRERAAEEAVQAAKQRKGIWGSTKEFLLSGMKKDEKESAERVNEGGVLSVLGEEGLMKMREEPGEDKAEDGGVLASVTARTQESHHESHSNRGTILETVEEKRREGEKALERKGVEGGLLDKLAQKAVEAGKADAGKEKGG
ncbi:Cytochrome c oxidase assembly protein COX14 [Lasallia pustulata]|uniref:Cytochrome c oxidase assembly protein COX14 n=1 Tax=Lasallia pustulata TaxID=136370 RepID=A0A1W5D539_9LECA|nr:Cytochrome c oxidase assembly protein COX14 [Lasallia pustulata]